MTRSMPVITIAAAALLAASCAPTTDGGAPPSDPSSGAARQCFSENQVRNFRQGSRVGQIYISTHRNQVFELNTSGGCTDLDFANRMAVVPDSAGLAGGRSCVGDQVRIVVPGRTSATSTCRARVTRVLTPEEVEALPPRQRP